MRIRRIMLCVGARAIDYDSDLIGDGSDVIGDGSDLIGGCTNKSEYV